MLTPNATRSSREHMWVFVLGVCLWVELLGHKAGICPAWTDSTKHCPAWLNMFAFPPVVHESYTCFTSSTALDVVQLLFPMIVVSWYLVMVLIGVFLTSDHDERHMHFWPFTYPIYEVSNSSLLFICHLVSAFLLEICRELFFVLWWESFDKYVYCK